MHGAQPGDQPGDRSGDRSAGLGLARKVRLPSGGSVFRIADEPSIGLRPMVASPLAATLTVG